jgi:hypothetical protein
MGGPSWPPLTQQRSLRKEGRPRWAAHRSRRFSRHTSLVLIPFLTNVRFSNSWLQF